MVKQILSRASDDDCRGWQFAFRFGKANRKLITKRLTVKEKSDEDI